MPAFVIAGLLLGVGSLVAVVDDGPPGPGAARAPADVSVDLPDPAPAPSSEPGPASSGSDPLPRDGSVTCLVEDCIAWELALSPERFPDGVMVTGDLVLLSQRGMPGVDEGAGSGSGPAGTPDPDALAGGLLAIDAVSGAMRWQLDVAPAPDGAGGLAVAMTEDQLLLMDAPGTLASYDPEGGGVRWRATLEEPSGASYGQGDGDRYELVQAERIGQDLLVVITSGGGSGGQATERVTSLDPDSGEQRWSSTGADRAVITEVGPVLFASGAIWGLDPSDGTQRWRRPLRAISSGIAVVGGLVVLESTRSSVVDAADGTVVTTFPDGQPARVGTRSASDGLGVLLFGHQEVHHIAPDGSVWTVSVAGCCLGWELDDETVTVLADDGSIMRLDRATGRLLGSQPAGRPQERAGRPALLMGGHLFVPDTDGVELHVRIEGPWSRRLLALARDSHPVALTAAGALVLVRPGGLVVLRPPAELADAPDLAP